MDKVFIWVSRSPSLSRNKGLFCLLNLKVLHEYRQDNEAIS